MGWPWNRGAFTQEYFPSSSNFVCLGTVSPSNGCLCQLPSYQECAIDSSTLSLK